jgi:iron complex outermembrane receptor protein
MYLKSALTSLLVFYAFAALSAETLDSIEVSTLESEKEEKRYIDKNESVSVLKTKNLNRGDVQNSLQMLSGLSNVQQSSSKPESFSIRGISDMGTTGYQKDNLASMMVDNVFQTPLAVRAGSFEQWDLHTIEVHRGAQSATQGVNSLAGSILLYHTKPQEENSGAAKMTLGNFGRKEAALVINHKALDDKLLIRTSYNKELSDGYITNKTTGNNNWGNKNKDHFVADFLYRISASDELRFNMKLLRFHRGGDYVQGSNYKKYQVFEDVDAKNITNNQQASLQYDKKFGNGVTNKVTFAYSQADNNSFSDADGTSQNTAGTRYENNKDQFYSLEDVLNFSGNKWKNSAGFHLHHYKLEDFYHFDLLLPLNATTSTPVDVTQSTDKGRDTRSIFDSFIYDFSEHHSINVGGRLEIVENKFDAGITGVRKQNLGGATNATVDSYLAGLQGNYGSSKTNSILIPKLSYTYKNQNYTLGSFYSQGYRTGGLSINRRKATVSTYGPEKTHNYELSYKYMKEKFLFTANVFYTKWNDQQVETRLSTDVYDTQVRNASKSELYGAEIEGNIDLGKGDSLRLNAGTVETHFLSFNNNGRSYTGNSFPDAAKYTGQVSYWKDIRHDLMAIFTTRYLSKSYSDPENTRKSPEQLYLDFNAQYSWKEFVFEGFVRNILDKKYRIYDGKPRTTNTPYQASYNRVNAPREFGVRANYYW